MEFKYSDMTDEKIKQEMLDEIDRDIRKQAGSFINDALSPVSIKLAEVYIELSVLKNQALAKNKQGLELDLHVKDTANIDRHRATKAIGLVTFESKQDITIEKNSIVRNENTSYKTLQEKQIKNGTVDILCECLEEGTIGNTLANTIIFTDILGVEKVYNKEDFVNGYDEETDEELYERYLKEIRTPSTSGNKYDYEKWAREIEEVGGAKAFPLKHGPGTVEVVIIDRNKGIASNDLIDKVKDHIEKKRPIGATVTVVTSEPLYLDIEADLMVASNHLIQDIQEDFIRALEEYRQMITFNETYISYAKIGSILLNVDGVLDYNNLLINGETKNISLNNDIPIFRSIDLDVMQ